MFENLESAILTAIDEAEGNLEKLLKLRDLLDDCLKTCGQAVWDAAEADNSSKLDSDEEPDDIPF